RARSSIDGSFTVEPTQRFANELLGAELDAVEVLEHLRNLGGLVAERDERATRLALGLRARRQHGGLAARSLGQPIAHLDEQPFGRLTADARHLREAHEILVAHALI